MNWISCYSIFSITNIFLKNILIVYKYHVIRYQWIESSFFIFFISSFIDWKCTRMYFSKSFSILWFCFAEDRRIKVYIKTRNGGWWSKVDFFEKLKIKLEWWELRVRMRWEGIRGWRKFYVVYHNVRRRQKSTVIMVLFKISWN